MHFTFKLRDQLEGNAPMTYNKGGGTQTTTSTGGLDPELKPYAIELAKRAVETYNVQDPFVRDGFGNVMRDGNGEPVYNSTANEAIRKFKELSDTGDRLATEARNERAALDQFKTEGQGALDARNFYTNQLNKDWGQMISNDLTKTASAQDMGMSGAGALGSARANMMKQGAITDRAIDLYQAQDASKSAAAQGLQGADKAFQDRYSNAVNLGAMLGEAEYKGAQAGVEGAKGTMEVPWFAVEKLGNVLGSGAMPTQEVQTQKGGNSK